MFAAAVLLEDVNNDSWPVSELIEDRDLDPGPCVNALLCPEAMTFPGRQNSDVFIPKDA